MSSRYQDLFKGNWDSFFQIRKHGSSVAVEFRGALTTFLTMSYILFANASILSAAGIPGESVIACTALVAGLASIAMGIFANFPLALASGMGLNAFVAFQIAPQVGGWQTAMGLVVLDGIIVAILVLLGVREAVMDAIPRSLKLAIGAGIGLFIAFIGLVNAKLVIVPPGTVAVLSQAPAAVLPPVTAGSLRQPEALVGLAGLLLTAILMARRVRGALLFGILGATAVAYLLGLSHLNLEWMAPQFDIVMKADVKGALQAGFLPLLIALVLVDFFDTLGTVTAVADEAGLQDKSGKPPRLKQILLVDSLSASLGGFFGVSSATSYVESAAGVAEGARTGLHSVFVGIFFLLAMFAAPVLSVVPGPATAPALILVGFLMSSHITQIDFKDWVTAIPAFVTLLTIPVTYSISHGIGFGFITYVVIALTTGRAKQVHPLMYISAAIFLGYFWVG
ncbi:MAG: NCS2 family permease [Bdellovibrionaceae bacterium]|nr:NCS2 family permease [Bdellovibrionales bacterium]MCB9253826.1 NCS2 family permease [Pseudobdellovibrionaceae bacterium]